VAPPTYSNKTRDASETDSESDSEHALSRYLSYRSRQSGDSDSSETTWDSDDHSDSASSYNEESDASDASEESNSSRHTDESDSSSDISDAEEASGISDADEYDDGVLLGDLPPQCTCQCAVHAPGVGGWFNGSELPYRR
jgi:hypothetical protein